MAVLMLVLLAGCRQNITGTVIGEQADALKIGAVLHLTGDQAEPAQAFLQGIQLAVDEINGKGGVLGKKLVIILEDDELKPRLAQTAAVKLVNADRVNAVILASYIEAMATGPYLEEQKIPSIVLWDSAKDIEDVGEYVFGIGIWTPSSGEVAADFIYENMGLRKIAIVNIQNEWSLAVSDFFKKEFEKKGGVVVDTQPILPSDTIDFRTTIMKVKESDADGIYSPITDGLTVFYKQLRELDFDKPIITSDIITENHIDVLKEAAEGIYQTQANDPGSPRTTHMKGLYIEKYNKELKQVLFASWGYDAVYMIKEAAERGNSADSESIKNNLYRIQGFEGASGIISIDSNGSSKSLEKVFQIRDGEFVLVE